ncbi:MAG: hypothetical protein V4579_12330 [Pseudomonadota bacterium]
MPTTAVEPVPTAGTVVSLRLALLAIAGAAALSGCYNDRGGVEPYSDRRLPAVRITGPDQSCIPLMQARESIVRDDRTIDFMAGTGRRGWRNVLPHSCPGLGFERGFSYETSLTQLCSTDIIRVLDRTGGDLRPGAACGLGTFTPVEFPRR